MEKHIQYFQEEAVGEARKRLVGRRIIPLYGPIGAGLRVACVPDLPALAPGVVEGERPDPAPLETKKCRVVELSLLSREFVHSTRDFDFADRAGVPVEPALAIQAAREVAAREDSLVFDSLTRAEGAHEIARSDWKESGAAYADVTRAIEALLGAGHTGPFGVAMHPSLFHLVNEQREKGGILPAKQLFRIVDAGFFPTPALAKGTAVVLAVSRENLDLAVGEDLRVSHVESIDFRHRFRVSESVAVRLKRPTAVAVLAEGGRKKK